MLEASDGTLVKWDEEAPAEVSGGGTKDDKGGVGLLDKVCVSAPSFDDWRMRRPRVGISSGCLAR